MSKKVKNTVQDEELNLIDDILNNAPKENLHFIDRSTEIVEQIYRILDKKGWKQKDLAEAMNKNEAEISKWFRGGYNFTLRTLAHIEVALNENLIYTKAGKQLENELLNRTETTFYSFKNDTHVAACDTEQLIPQVTFTNGTPKAA
ncbi:MAG: hypothetical protein RLZZ367_2387, partial [Bacteroidota bacterium]|jgi:transcriptional regulator with XRE-family HTH domain